MAFNYTCRACTKALSTSAATIPRTSRTALHNARRRFSTTTPSLYHASHSLRADPNQLLAEPNASPADRAAANSKFKSLKAKYPRALETYVAYGAMQGLIKECSRPGDYKIPQVLEKNGEIPTDENGTHIGEGEGWWYDTLGLKPTFSNWSQITFIHMYMLQVRFRMLPETHASVWIQHLTNQAFWAAEDRLVIWHKFNANTQRQKHLKDMFSQWRAVLLAYDEGLVKGDAMLAAAIWRNLLGCREDADFEKLAQIVGYMRRELKRLSDAPDEDILSGDWTFRGEPGDEAGLVKQTSRMMTSQIAKA